MSQQATQMDDPGEAIEQQYGVLKADNDPRDPEEIARTIVKRHPIELDPQINTLAKPVVLQVACPGWQPKYWPPRDAYPEGQLPPNYTEPGDVRSPGIPCSIEDQAAEIVTAADEGCAAAHIHPRDPEDCLATDDVDLLSGIYDRIRSETDVVAMQHTWEITPEGGIDYVSKAREKLEAGDGTNKYVEGAVVLWPVADSYPKNYEESVREGVEFYEENDIKPIHKFRSTYNAREMHRMLVETETLSDEPYVLVHDMGHPFGWPMDNRWYWPTEMINSIRQTQERFGEDHVIGVFSGNRNWMPVTMLAILLGVDVVRLGIEDFHFMYPHRDDVIQRNIDCIKKITEFCELIGRPVATPDQAREIMGMTPTF